MVAMPLWKAVCVAFCIALPISWSLNIYDLEFNEHVNTSNTFSVIRQAIINYKYDINRSLFPTNIKLICYFIFTNNFDPIKMKNLCTHIHIGFFGIDEQTSSLQVSTDNLEIFQKVLLLKKKSNDLKVIIAVGGAQFSGFNSMIQLHVTRKRFIRSVMTFIKKYQIDGVDLDWEWPVLNGTAKEKIKFIQLLYEFRQEFNLHKKEYILSVDVSASKTISELAYNIHYMADYVNYVIIMCYDYHYYTKWYPFTGHNSPLYPSSFDPVDLNANYSVHYWISNAMPRKKIILGVPTYGHTYRLTFPSKSALHAPTSGVGNIGNNGFASYPEICKFISDENATIVFDDVSKVPYAYKYPDWVSYDDETSLMFKAEYVKNATLGGIMTYSANADDYLGICAENGTPFPLIRKIKSILFNEI